MPPKQQGRGILQKVLKGTRIISRTLGLLGSKGSTFDKMAQHFAKSGYGKKRPRKNR